MINKDDKKQALNALQKAVNLLNKLSSEKFEGKWPEEDNCQNLSNALNKLSAHVNSFSEQQIRINQQQKLFDELVNNIYQSPELENLLQTTVKGVRMLLNSERVVFYKFNQDNNGTIIAESVADGVPSILDQTIEDHCFEELIRKRYLKKGIRLINDIYEDSNLTDFQIEILEKCEIRANMVAPIRDPELRLYGLLMVQNYSDIRIWQDDESHLLSGLAQKFEYHLQHLNLIAQHKTLSQQRQFIKAIVSRAREVPHQEILFKGCVEGVKELLEVERVVIYQFNPDWSGQIVAESVTEGFSKAMNDEIQDPCFKRIYTEQYKTGRIRAVNNVYEDETVTDCYLNLLERYQVKANLVVPLRQDEKLYGLLIAHQCTKFRHWQKSELNFLSELGEEMGYSLEYIHSIEQQEEIAKQRQLISAIVSRAREVPHQEILFKGCVEGVKELLEVERVVIYQFNPDWSGQIVAESVTEGFRKAMNDEIQDPCFKRIYTEQYKNGRIRAVNNVYQDETVTDCYLNLLERYQVKANLVVPLRQDEKLYGLLIAHQCTKFRHWQKSEIDFFSQLVTEVGYALDYINFIHQQETNGKKAWLFGDIAFGARQSLNLGDIFKTTVQGVRQMLETDRVVIYQFNSDWSGTMIAESVATGFTSVLQETINDPCFQGRYVELYRNGRIRAINNIYKEPNLTDCHVRTLEKYQVKGNLVAPIRKNKELMALLIAHHCRAPRMWQESEIEFFSELVNQVEYAIDHLSYIEKIKTNAYRSRLFQDIAFRARQSLNQDDVLATAIQGLRRGLDTDRVVIYTFNVDGSGTMTHESVAEGWTKVMNEKIDDPCFRGSYLELYQNGRVRTINDIYNEPGLSDCHIRTLEQYDVKANLVAPLRKEKKLFALLIAHNCRAPRIWQKSEIEFFVELATQTEYALDHISYIKKLEQAKVTAEKASSEQRSQKEAVEQQLAELIKDVEPAFQGNLTVRTKITEGEIKPVADFVNSTLENLQKIVQQVKLTSEEVIYTVNLNKHYIEATSKETIHQAESVTIALDQIQQMDNSIQTVANHAQEAKNQVKLATSTIKEGDETMNQTVEGILDVRETVEETASKLKSLGEASQKISRVVNLIKDLANQTQILALNASIETRGLEENRQGFAVVAEEVRSLSKKSTSATQEIEEILEQIQLEVNLVTTAMEKGRDQVLKSVDLVTHTRDQLNSITSATDEIRNLVKDVAQAAIAHAQTSSSISKTMEEVEEIAQNTSQQSVKGAESFANLLQVAQDLQESVTKFKIHS